MHREGSPPSLPLRNEVRSGSVPRISKQQQQQVRAALLKSAAQHFAAHGLSGANINRISLDAGFAKGTVYNYFPSKEALFCAVLSTGSDVTVERYHAQQPSGSVREHLLVLAEQDVAVVREHEAFMKVIVAELLSARSSAREAIDRGLAPLMQLVVGLVLRGQQTGELRSTLDPLQLSTMFLGQMTALYALHWRSGGTWPSWDELPALLVDQFIDGAGSSG